jgi:hypothetical protein
MVSYAEDGFFQLRRPYAQPRTRESNVRMRRYPGSVPAASLRFPLVGTEHFIDHEQMKFIC